MEKPKNIILEKSIDFALGVITYCELLEERKKLVIAKQLLSSGTSIGANVHEAQNAESTRDFVHKLKIAAKELDETAYWLTLCEKSNSYPFDPQLKQELHELRLILSKILGTMLRGGKPNND